MKYKIQILALLLVILSVTAYSQQIPPKPKHYYCYTAVDTIIIDGILDEESWKLVEWSDFFVDIEGIEDKIPEYETRFKMVRNIYGLYIAAYLEEPHINAAITENERILYQDNDFEVFLDPDGDNHNYYELEINANNATWDLYMQRPYRDHSPANSSWDIKGLKTAVGIYGSVNDPSDQDSCWIIEMLIPWKSIINNLAERRPPRSREVWRANFSRVQWNYEAVEGKYLKKKIADSDLLQKENNWVWSPQWVVNMHNPETWGYIIFAGHPLSMEPILADPDTDYELKMYLIQLYRMQKRFFLEHQFYAKSLRELTGMKEGLYPVKIETTSRQLLIQSSNYKDKNWYIDQHRKLWSEPIQRKK